MAKDLTTLISNLRTDLSDIGETEWIATELERAIERALSDLSRFVPRELIFDITLTTSIIQDNVRIDLSNYIDAVDGMEGFIRVQRVEYITGSVPQIFCQFELFGTMLTITGLGESGSQETLGSGNTLRIYYEAPHTMPDDDVAGSCPVFLENTVILAASAYALFQRALNFLHQADTDSGLARTALAAAATALDKVATYLENNSDENSKYWLTKITTDITGLRTAILEALNCTNTYLDDVKAVDILAADNARANYMGATGNYVDGASAPGVKKYLDDGDAYLNKIADGGEGQEVPGAYRQYAQTVRDGLIAPHERDREFKGQNATFKTNAAMIYVQEAAQRLSNLRSYIEQADAWGSIATRFINEAEQRLVDAVQYSNIASANMTLADKFREQAIERRNEAWSIWRDRTQYIGDFATGSIRQMPS